MDNSLRSAISYLEQGGVGVLPTDTLYGLVGWALNQEAVERIYDLKGRDSHKPFIILIASIADLAHFSVEASSKMLEVLNTYWPGPVSIILPSRDNRFAYLHRGSQSLAFRLPNSESLQQLLQKTGPLVAPSANPQGEPPAKTVGEAKAYFGDQVDFYSDAGRLDNPPSTLLTVDATGEVTVLRQGSPAVSSSRETP